MNINLRGLEITLSRLSKHLHYLSFGLLIELTKKQLALDCIKIRKITPIAHPISTLKYVPS